MSKISSYGIVSPPVAGDLVIGTNTIDSNKTKNLAILYVCFYTAFVWATTIVFF